VTWSSQVTTLTVLVSFLHGNVRHEALGGCPVPVLLTGLDVDHIAGTDLLDIAAATGDKPNAVSDVQGLALRVVVPGSAGARCEPYVSAADRRLLVWVADAVDLHGADELCLWSSDCLAAALCVLHDAVLLLVVQLCAVDAADAAGDRKAT
jgi:hypothetical protein